MNDTRVQQSCSAVLEGQGWLVWSGAQALKATRAPGTDESPTTTDRGNIAV